MTRNLFEQKFGEQVGLYADDPPTVKAPVTPTIPTLPTPEEAAGGPPAGAAPAPTPATPPPATPPKDTYVPPQPAGGSPSPTPAPAGAQPAPTTSPTPTPAPAAGTAAPTQGATGSTTPSTIPAPAADPVTADVFVQNDQRKPWQKIFGTRDHSHAADVLSGKTVAELQAEEAKKKSEAASSPASASGAPATTVPAGQNASPTAASTPVPTAGAPVAAASAKAKPDFEYDNSKKKIPTTGDGVVTQTIVAQDGKTEVGQVTTINTGGIENLQLVENSRTGDRQWVAAAGKEAVVPPDYVRGYYNEHIAGNIPSEYAREDFWNTQFKDKPPIDALNAMEGYGSRGGATIPPEYLSADKALEELPYEKPAQNEKTKGKLGQALTSVGGSSQRLDRVWQAKAEGKTAEGLLKELDAEGSGSARELLTSTNEEGKPHFGGNGGKDYVEKYDERNAEWQAKVKESDDALRQIEAQKPVQDQLKIVEEAEAQMESFEAAVKAEEPVMSPEKQTALSVGGDEALAYLNARNAYYGNGKDVPADQSEENLKKLEKARSEYVQASKDAIQASSESAKRELGRLGYNEVQEKNADIHADYEAWNADVIDAAEKKDAGRLSRLLSTKDDKVKVETTEAGRIAHSEATGKFWERVGKAITGPTATTDGIVTAGESLIKVPGLIKTGGEMVQGIQKMIVDGAPHNSRIEARLGESAKRRDAVADKEGRFAKDIGVSRFKDGSTDNIGAKDKKGTGMMAEMIKEHRAKGAEFDDLANQSTEQGAATLKARGEGAAQLALADKTEEEAEKIDIRNDNKAGDFA